MPREARFILALLLLALPAAAQPTDPDPFAGAATLDRAALTAAVRERNPTLEAARLAWRAAAARPAQERALDNLMVSYGAAPLSLGGGVPFGQSLEVRQALPYPGKRRVRTAMAEAEAEAAFQGYQKALLELTTEASLLFDDWYLVHRALAINAEHRLLLADFQSVAAERYAAGLAPQQSPIQAEVEGGRLLLRDAELETERRRVTARLNALLHRAADLPLPPPPARLPDPEPPPADDLPAAALAGRPEIAGRAAEVRVREAALEAALLERRPDFEVMASYSSMWMDPEHRFMAGVAVDLPIWRQRTEAARAEAEARLAQARSERAALEDQVRAQVRTALDRLDETRRALSIYRDRLLPAARDQIRAARAAFETGGGFLDVIEAERSLRDLELGHEETLTEAHRRRAELDRVLGRGINQEGGPQ
jgi:cobalt-zinc-cadmium efflux system outer membrane protein